MNNLTQQEINNLAKLFDIKPSEIIWYNSGICYSRIRVTTQEAADKVTKAVSCEFVNGGFCHGRSLGYQRVIETDNDTICYEVTC